MATEQPKPATEDVKMDLFEDDDEFEEFEINEGIFFSFFQSNPFINFCGGWVFFFFFGLC